MYKCEAHGCRTKHEGQSRQTGPRKKCHKLIVVVRQRRDGGTEIVKEIRVCDKCLQHFERKEFQPKVLAPAL